jgi:hypothetical protein
MGAPNLRLMAHDFVESRRHNSGHAGAVVLGAVTLCSTASTFIKYTSLARHVGVVSWMLVAGYVDAAE